MPANQKHKPNQLPAHFVSGNPITPPFPADIHEALFGLGCYWGAERKFWQQNGVFSTAVGFGGGNSCNPSYAAVCTGLTYHNEVVKVFFRPDIDYQQLLAIFWQAHDPTQGMRQGNDVGSQYRSGIYTFNNRQLTLAENSKKHYQKKLDEAGIGRQITTEILPAPPFYYAEVGHQQYLAKNPTGYCGLGGLGVAF